MEAKISHSGLLARSPEGHAAHGMQIKGNEDVWVEIQANTFRNWVNEHLPTNLRVADLSKDLSSGVSLCALVEDLQGRPIKPAWNKRPMNQHHYLENVAAALNAIEQDGVKLVNIERGECSPSRTDDAFLLRFLRAREFVVQRAHRLLVNYCYFKDNNPDLYDVDLQKLRDFYASNILSTMPFCDQHGRRICIFRPGVWDLDKISQPDALQAFVLSVEVGAWEPRSQIAGAVGIFDLSNSSLRQALLFTPNTVSKILHLLSWSYPVRMSKIHVVFETPVLNVGLALLKPFLGEETIKTIVFHGNDLSTLHEDIDPKYLPERYGGIHPDYNSSKWLECMALYPEELHKTGYYFF